MRILVVNKFWSQVGGVERHVHDVVEWLEGQGHEVISFAMEEPGVIETAAPGARVSYVDMRSKGFSRIRGMERAVYSSESRRVVREIIATGVDAAYVVHIYHQIGTVILNELAHKNVPTILSLHDYKVGCPNYRLFSERTNSVCTTCLTSRTGYLWAPAMKRCWGGSATAGLMLSLEAAATKSRHSYQQAGVVTTLNSLQERVLERAGVDKSTIFRLPHPVELQPERQPRRREHTLYAGRLVPEKGVDVAIRASAESGVPLLIAGEGRSEAALRELAQELRAPAQFMGPQDSASLKALMLDAAALVVPSIWHEVSPLVSLEAIALDVPVIASALGGLADQLEDGRGLLVEAGDSAQLALAMKRAVEEPLEMENLSKAARAHAEEVWTHSAWQKGMVEVFARVGVDIST